MAKLAMAGYTTTGADLFTNGDPTKTVSLVILEGVGTKDHYSFETGVKYKTIIPFLNNVDVDVSTGNQSGYNIGSDGVNVKDVTLEDVQLSLKGSYDPWVVQKYLIGLQVAGSDAEKGIPLQNLILELKGKALHAFNEKFIWQANNDASTTVLTNAGVTAGSTMNSFDGILAQVAGIAGGYGNADVAFTGIADTSTLFHVATLVQKMQTAAPQLLDIPTTLSMSPGNFAQYSRAIYALNGTITRDTIGVDGKGIKELYVPGTQTRVVSEIGLSGRNELFLSYPDNIKVVYDLVDESDNLKFFYSQDADKWIMRGNYKLGVKVIDPSMCFVSA